MKKKQIDFKDVEKLNLLADELSKKYNKEVLKFLLITFKEGLKRA